MDPIEEAGDGVIVTVWVVPGASRTEVTGLHDGAVRIRVAAPPEGGRANRAVADLLGRTLGSRRVELRAGASGRRKRFFVGGVASDEVHRALLAGD